MRSVTNWFVILLSIAHVLATPLHASDEIGAYEEERQRIENKIASDAQILWQVQEFDLIETMAAEFRDPKFIERMPRAWAHDFYLAFWGALDGESLKRYELQWAASKEAWRHRYPHSTTRELAEVAMYLVAGNFYRGERYTHETDPENLHQAYEYYAKAYDILIAAGDRLKEDYVYFLLRLDLESRLGMSQEKMIRSVFEGFQRFPYILRLPANATKRLLPKWGGSIPLLTGFIETIVKASPPERRYQTYAQLFSSLRSEYEFNNLPYLDKEHLRRMLIGLRDAHRRRPSITSGQDLMILGCQSRDKKIFVEIATETREDPSSKLATYEGFCADRINDLNLMVAVPLPRFEDPPGTASGPTGDELHPILPGSD